MLFLHPTPDIRIYARILTFLCDYNRLRSWVHGQLGALFEFSPGSV